MNTILITGANGFIGKNLCKKYHESGYKVYGIGHGVLDNKKMIEFGMHDWRESDVSLPALLDYNINFDLIIHCAGSSSVTKSFEDPLIDFQKTVLSTLSVLEFIRIKKLNSKLVYLSSSAVYGTNANFTEEAICNPISPYGVHKLQSENLCRSYNYFFGIKCCIIRIFSVYGPGLNRQLIWDAVNKFEQSKKPIFFGTGSEVRDWIYINDIVSLIYNLSFVNFSFDIFNGGTGIGLKISEVIDLIKKYLNIDIEHEFNLQVPNGDPSYLVANTNKIKKLIWHPNTNIEQGLHFTIKNIYKKYK